jgi:hypothetical protein
MINCQVVSPLSKGLKCNSVNDADDRTKRWKGKLQYIRKRE